VFPEAKEKPERDARRNSRRRKSICAWHHTGIAPTIGMVLRLPTSSKKSYGKRCGINVGTGVFVPPTLPDDSPTGGGLCLRFGINPHTPAKLAWEKLYVWDATKSIELRGRSGLAPRLERRCRRQAAHDDLAHFLFFNMMGNGVG
jgi:hypothetical protein